MFMTRTSLIVRDTPPRNRAGGRGAAAELKTEANPGSLPIPIVPTIPDAVEVRNCLLAGGK
jgi:hypothetical protein